MLNNELQQSNAFWRTFMSICIRFITGHEWIPKCYITRVRDTCCPEINLHSGARARKAVDYPHY